MNEIIHKNATRNHHCVHEISFSLSLEVLVEKIFIAIGIQNIVQLKTILLKYTKTFTNK